MDAKKLNIEDLLRKIKDGAIQLHDFQRKWIGATIKSNRCSKA